MTVKGSYMMDQDSCKTGGRCQKGKTVQHLKLKESHLKHELQCKRDKQTKHKDVELFDPPLDWTHQKALMVTGQVDQQTTAGKFKKAESGCIVRKKTARQNISRATCPGV